MQIRLMGSRDLLKRLRNLLDKQARLYPNKNSNDYRLYLNIDDRNLEQWLNLFENSEYPIEIDPKDFR